MINFFRAYKFVSSVLLLLMCATALPINASMTIGRNGKAYEENGILWQPVKFSEELQGFNAIFPGEPESGMITPWYFIYSKYQNNEYEIHTHINERYVLPKTKKDFLKNIKKTLSENDVAKVIKAKEPVRYAAEIQSFENDSHEKLKKICRVYWTSDERIYFAIIAGDDFTLAEDFFKSIQFKSDE